MLGVFFFFMYVSLLILYVIGRCRGFHTIDNLLEILLTFIILYNSFDVAGREFNGKLFIVYCMAIGMFNGTNFLGVASSHLVRKSILAFIIVFLVNTAYTIFIHKYKKRPDWQIKSWKDRAAKVLRSLASMHLLFNIEIAFQCIRQLNLDSEETRKFFYGESSFSEISYFLFASLNLVVSTIGICKWFFSYKKNMAYMLRNSSYCMLTCAKYGIRFDLVTQVEKNKLKRRAKSMGTTYDAEYSQSRAHTRAWSRFTTPVLVSKKTKMNKKFTTHDTVSRSRDTPSLKVSVSNLNMHGCKSTRENSPYLSPSTGLMNSKTSHFSRPKSTNLAQSFQGIEIRSSRFKQESDIPTSSRKSKFKKTKLDHVEKLKRHNSKKSFKSKSSKKSKKSNLSSKNRSYRVKQMNKIQPIVLSEKVNFAKPNNKVVNKLKFQKKKTNVTVEHQMNVNFSKIQYDHKISSFSVEQEDLLTCFLAGINSDCFTVNKRISFENKKGFFNILAAGA